MNMSQWIGLVTEYEEHGRGLAKSDLKFGDKNHVFVPGRKCLRSRTICTTGKCR